MKTHLITVASCEFTNGFNSALSFNALFSGVVYI